VEKEGSRQFDGLKSHDVKPETIKKKKKRKKQREKQVKKKKKKKKKIEGESKGEKGTGKKGGLFVMLSGLVSPLNKSTRHSNGQN